MARYIAKNIVAAKLADTCEVQLSYAIGLAKPISVLIDTEGSAKISEKKLSKIVTKLFPLTPGKMIAHLKLVPFLIIDLHFFCHFDRNESRFIGMSEVEKSVIPMYRDSTPLRQAQGRSK